MITDINGEKIQSIMYFKICDHLFLGNDLIDAEAIVGEPEMKWSKRHDSHFTPTPHHHLWECTRINS